MTERTLTLPTHLFRRLTGPAGLAALAAVCAAALAPLLRRTWEPQLPRMSDSWLRRQDHDFDRYDPWREY